MLATGRRSLVSIARYSLLAIACAVASSGTLARAATAPRTVLELDPARSTVTWKLGALLHTVDGTFALKRGTIAFDPANGGASGDVVLDLTSGRSGDAKRDRRMQTEILQTQTYPDAVFTADHVAGSFVADKPSTLDVHGTMLVHGTSHEMTLHVAIARAGTLYRAHAQFAIPYVAWGMKDPSTFVLRVNNYVDLDIDAAIASVRTT